MTDEFEAATQREIAGGVLSGAGVALLLLIVGIAVVYWGPLS